MITNGPPPFTGTGDPARLTLDMGKPSGYWSTDMYSRLATAKLHSFNAPTPQVPGLSTDKSVDFNLDPAAGPLAVDGQLELVERTELGFEASGTSGGTAAGLAFDPSTGLFGVVTTDAGLFYVEDDFSTVVSHGLVDAINGNDIETTVDAAFFGPNRLIAMASNKTIYGADRLDGGQANEADAWKEYRDTTGDLEPAFGVKGRPMLKTIRAKKAYALSLAADQETQSFYVVSVPHEGNPSVVVSKFAAGNMLSAEGILTAADDSETDVVYQLDGLN
ncbi:hypothetical protein V5R04_02950 [Jonesiaceae bacterium BS-20]|uniref:Phytase-like domain-containing protein n=1 Tax=Jonesiaceae bacterium BS-20 TaxID=3120821 RepID=A0AAU7DYB0_9MICO